VPVSSPPSSELNAEVEHLAESRAALKRMHAKVSGLQADGGNAVSTEYLKAALYRRMRALEDDPSVPLFFGRLDYADGAEQIEIEHGERFYVGRRHVSDPQGDPMVVDWRAEVSRAFYRARPRESYGVRMRRRFGFVQGRLTAYEDEVLDGSPTGDAENAILQAEIERPRVGPMRDIVATIQPEQDEIVRAGLATSVCVQGAPGTGKTAVGLHRAAYLLYAHRDQLTRQGVLVVGPNDSFLRYIGDVLPALGEIDAEQLTVEGLTGRVAVRATEPTEVARLKGDARMAVVVERAVWHHLSVPTEPLVVPRGSRRWRVPAYEAEEILAELRRRGVRYGAGRTMLAQRLAHTILVKMENDGDSPDDRVQDSVARSRPVKAYVDAVWPKLDPATVVCRLLSDPALLAAAADGVLDEAEQRLLLWAKPARGPRSARWSVADAVLVDEAADRIDRTPSVGHVVLDEAQDLSPMMLRAVGRRCSTGSMTVLGDLAQATTAWATRSWDEALHHLGQPGALVEELTLGFRVPADVIAFAARLLPVIAPQLAPPRSVRRGTGDLDVRRLPQAERDAAAAATVAAALQREGSVGVIVPDALLDGVRRALAAAGVDATELGDESDAVARVDLVPASLAKGLEFDTVVLVEPAAIVAGEHDEVTGLRRLYVCLTRAVTSLTILHSDPLPTLLADPGSTPDAGARGRGPA
jgi:DNA helicase IV